MGVLAWSKLTSQLSLYIDFTTGGTCYDPKYHVDSGEMSPVGKWKSMAVITMSLNFIVPVSLQDKGDFSKAPLDLWLAWDLVLGFGSPSGFWRKDQCYALMPEPIFALGKIVCFSY